jgi:hypothetical protein
MKTRATLFHILLLLAACVSLQGPAAGADLLDIKAIRLQPVGPVYPNYIFGQPAPATHPLRCLADQETVLLREGESIGLYCSFSMNIVNSNTCWVMNTPWKNSWPGYFTYAGNTIHSFNFTIPYDTALGTCTGETGLGTPCFPDFWNECTSTYTNYYPKSISGGEFFNHLGFTAKVGLHTVTCAVDTPKSFSDRYSSNNKAYLRIKVLPKKGMLTSPSSWHQCKYAM